MRHRAFAGRISLAFIVAALAVAAPTPWRGTAQSGTPSPVASPAASPTTGTVLYAVDDTGGLAAWPLAGGWRHSQRHGHGVLINDGTGGELVVPYRVGVAAYAVEADIQVVRATAPGAEFGLTARDGGVRAGVSAGGAVSLAVGDAAAGGVAPASGTIPPVAGGDVLEWHTYRLEVTDDGIRFSIDGSPVTTVGRTDAAIAGGGGQTGVWAAAGIQLMLDRFTVIAL
jgi:hypothetical protein